ncbi:hypothetical protein [Paenibacillus lautus]|uniref:hypothetical protein n=1 Tax=Paenibacillus lautus TaxID=1401 RepID=UPI003D26DB16
MTRTASRRLTARKTDLYNQKNKKVIELKVSGKTLVIDPLVVSPAGHIHIYYKWWDGSRA